MPASIRSAALLAVVALVACHDATGPRSTAARLTILAGAKVTDTIQAQPLQALIVEVRDSSGAPLQGVVVRFEAQPPADSTRHWESAIQVEPLTGNVFSSFATDQTDAHGRAKALIRLGSVAGPAAIAIKVPELGLEDTARFTVTPGAAARLLIHVRDTLLYAGGQYAIGASAADRFGNLRPTDVVSYTASASSITVSAAGLVTANSDGRVAIVVASGSARDTAHVSVPPRGIMVFVNNYPHGVGIVNLDGSGYRFLHPIVDYSVFPQWSPDGQSVVMYEGDPNSNARLTIMDLSGNTRTVLALPVDSLIGLAWPRFAPDGTIYFGGVTSNIGQMIWNVHADGTGLREIPQSNGNGSYEHPVVSPDGRTLLFDNAMGGGLSTIDLATDALHAIGSGTWPSYSPDGSMMAFVRQSAVLVADASGANARIVWPAGYLPDGAAPSWTSDGRWVVIPTQPVTLVRVTDLNTMTLGFTVNYFQPAVR